MCGLFLFIDKTGFIDSPTRNKVKKVCEEFIDTRGPDFSDSVINYIILTIKS